MLTKSHGTCECCSTPGRWLYQWHTFRYCATCLHSIGRRADGQECTDMAYRRAWRELAR